MDLLPYLIAGLVTGSVYALTATGLVLTYKTSAVFNFGHGAIATIAAYAFYSLHVQQGLPWGIAALLCVVVLGPALGLLMELLSRSLVTTPLVYKVTATVGVLLVVQAAVTVIYGTDVRREVPQYLPTKAWAVGDTTVRADQVVVVLLALVATVGLSVFLRRARLGTAMRAVVDNADLLDLAGTSPTQVRRTAWCIGSAFACASGVLLSPLMASLDAISLTFLVVTAFGAAAVGAFTSLPMTYVGAIAIGIGQAVLQKYVTSGFWTGLSPALPFIVLFGVLLLLPKRRLVEHSAPPVQSRHLPDPPLALQLGSGALLFLLLLAVPLNASLDLLSWTNGLTYVMVFSSLGLLVRASGQVSLAHVTFMAIGACAMAHLATDQGLPWAVAVLSAGLIAVPIGALLAIPAIRLSGLYLALATFGFGILVQFMFYTEDFMFGSFGQGLIVPRPGLESLATDKGYYYLVLGITALTSALTVTLTRSRMGRLLRGLTDSPTALSTAGAAVKVTRVLVFSISAFIAAVAGALQGASTLVVTADPFQPVISLILFITVVVSVGREPWYAVGAAFVVFIVPTLPGMADDTSSLITLLIGLVALFIGVRPKLTAALAPYVPWKERARPGRRSVAPVLERRRSQGGGIEVDGLRVQFGGIVAVDGVTLSAPVGRITGLIGPNGAGKTTTFNACSGLNRPTAGVVRLDGDDVSRLAPASRARRGLGRTFQKMELFDSMTVRQNVELGAEARFAGANPLSHVAATPGQVRQVRAEAADAIRLCGLDDLADRSAGSLSTGQRRLVELARCLAGPYDLLLLDEPSSGLDPAETERFGDILTEVVRERGVGILIVEHDMALVTSICDYLYVLDFGKPIFEGTTEETLAAPVVRAAYLGGDEVEDALRIDSHVEVAPSSGRVKETSRG